MKSVKYCRIVLLPLFLGRAAFSLVGFLTPVARLHPRFCRPPFPCMFGSLLTVSTLLTTLRGEKTRRLGIDHRSRDRICRCTETAVARDFRFFSVVLPYRAWLIYSGGHSPALVASWVTTERAETSVSFYGLDRFMNSHDQRRPFVREALGSTNLTGNSTGRDCSIHGGRNYRYRSVLHRGVLITPILSGGDISAALKREHKNMVID